MSNSNNRKAALLGMPIGTASGRLRKSIMFVMVQRLGLDTCFRCGQRIVSVEELSIEHKVPWMVDDPQEAQRLFYDLNNIAFSHSSCNSTAADRSTGRTSLRKEGPEGTCWCPDCDEFRPSEEFGSHKGTWNEKQRYCAKHKRERQKGWNARYNERSK